MLSLDLAQPLAVVAHDEETVLLLDREWRPGTQALSNKTPKGSLVS
ncbi:MAG: hypothetical protein AAF089_17385 [Bacteroidota bacterium]